MEPIDFLYIDRHWIFISNMHDYKKILNAETFGKTGSIERIILNQFSNIAVYLKKMVRHTEMRCFRN